MKDKTVLVWVMLAVGVICILAYGALKPKAQIYQQPLQRPTDSDASSQSSTPAQESPPPRTFAGEPCTSDCSGHEAGYNWAEEHDIDDVEDCDTAGETSNSSSFAEGCRAYVLENNPDTDDDNDDPDQ